MDEGEVAVVEQAKAMEGAHSRLFRRVDRCCGGGRMRRRPFRSSSNCKACSVSHTEHLHQKQKCQLHLQHEWRGGRQLLPVAQRLPHPR